MRSLVAYTDIGPEPVAKRAKHGNEHATQLRSRMPSGGDRCPPRPGDIAAFVAVAKARAAEDRLPVRLEDPSEYRPETHKLDHTNPAYDAGKEQAEFRVYANVRPG